MPCRESMARREHPSACATVKVLAFSPPLIQCNSEDA